jgi:hypothetical protein
MLVLKELKYCSSIRLKKNMKNFRITDAGHDSNHLPPTYGAGMASM